jgi:hypothetical protein
MARGNRLGGIVVAGLLALAPVPAVAQEAPLSAVDTGPPPRWRFVVTADGSWYENARFLAADEPATWSTSGRASLSLQQGFSRGSFSLTGHGGTIYYPEIDSFNQATYGGSFGLGWAPSRRTEIKLGQTYDHSNTRQLSSLDLEGLPLPTSGIDTASTSVGLNHGLSQRWQIGLTGAFTRRRYDNSALIGGEQLNGSAELARGLGQHSAAYMSYGYSSSWWSGRNTRAHQVLLGARRRKQHVGVELAGGVAYVENVGQWYPAGNAGLTATGRKATFALRYSRNFGLAFGYGRQMIADLASATLGYTPVRRFGLTAGYSFGYRRDPAQDAYRIRSHVASTGFSWGITRDLGFAAHYYWERNDTEGFPVVDGSRAIASLSYGVSWR